MVSTKNHLVGQDQPAGAFAHGATPQVAAPSGAPRLPFGGEQFADAAVQLSLLLGAEFYRAWLLARPTFQRYWRDHFSAIQHITESQPKETPQSTRVQQNIGFAYAKHLRFEAAVLDVFDEGDAFLFEVPSEMLDFTNAREALGLDRLTLGIALKRDKDDKFGGQCWKVSDRSYCISSVIDKWAGVAAMEPAWAETEMARWLINHFRHELQHIATTRWPRRFEHVWSPVPPGNYYWVQPHEISCVAAQTALVGHIAGRCADAWETLEDTASVMTLRRILGAIGRHNLPVPGYEGQTYHAIFERMHSMHRSHLDRSFPSLHGVGPVRALEIASAQLPHFFGTTTTAPS